MKTNRAPEKGKAVYEHLRPLLFSIAYRMVGSASEAEDIVQEAFLRYHRETTAGTEIDSPKKWLSTVTTRLAINYVQSARVRRESYVGTWLPEPLITDTESDGARHAETADSLSLAFLVLLESLGPVERAVFLLREVFDYGYDEIAVIVGKSEDNCRQIALRARRQIEGKKPRFEASRKKRDELSRRFFGAVMAGDTEGLIQMLAADVVAYGDGGGKARALPRPVHGRDKVARLFLRARGIEVASLRHVEVNGQPGALLLDQTERPVVVLSLDIVDGLVQTVRAVSNPDKLRHLDERSAAERRS
jgi:RNA polymerase sigma-70 factor (ECF subfamily)